MTLSWTDPVSTDFWDAYLDWSHLLHSRRAALEPKDAAPHTWFEPIFVRLLDPSVAARKTLVRLIDTTSEPFVMDPGEYAWLTSRIDDPDTLSALPDEYALYRRMGTAPDAQAALFELLDVGTPVDIDIKSTPSPRPCAAGRPKVDAPIVAVIDDGIAFLNRRFRKTAEAGETTRFHAVWLQSDRKASVQNDTAPARSTWTGEVLTAADINAYFEAGTDLDEGAIYRALNDRLFGATGHRSTEFSRSHGTHVLDLAAGADPTDTDDPARDWPLLAVQLPPEAIEDTSGMRAESYMVQGLRWVLRQAREIAPDQPVIVNISLGVVAGPKDGTRFAEHQLSKEARNWETATGQPVRLVFSFGNNQRSRQIAQVDYPQASSRHATDTSLTWRAQPCDLTASYLEISADRPVASDALELQVTAPCGLASGFAAIPVGATRTLTRNGAPVARIYHVPPHPLGSDTEQRSFYTIALAPTEGLKALEPSAPAGGWTVSVRYRAPEPASLHFQIQRGESLPGYRPRGRQSYFDGPDAYGWDTETQDTRGLEPDCPIRRQGSHSALVTGKARQVFSVGAARTSPEASASVPARYTAEGAAWSIEGPTVAATAEDGAVLSGILATGTMSGSAMLLNGTSAAAGRITRALALSSARILANAKSKKATRQIDDFDPEKVTLTATDPNDRARLGEALVDPGAGVRQRRDPV